MMSLREIIPGDVVDDPHVMFDGTPQQLNLGSGQVGDPIVSLDFLHADLKSQCAGENRVIGASLAVDFGGVVVGVN